MARPGATLAHLGATLAHLGATLTRLGATLARPGATLAHLGPTWRPIGASLRHICASWRHLCSSWVHLGATLAFQAAFQAQLGLKFALQAALQVQLGASWVDFWCSCNPQNRALASTRAQFSWFSHFCSPSALGLLFRSSAVGLRRPLDSTWKLLEVSWAALRLVLAARGTLLARS